MPKGQPVCRLAHAFSVRAALSRTFDIPTTAPFAAYLASACHRRHASTAQSTIKHLDRHDIKPESLAGTFTAHKGSNIASNTRKARSSNTVPTSKWLKRQSRQLGKRSGQLENHSGQLENQSGQLEKQSGQLEKQSGQLEKEFSQFLTEYRPVDEEKHTPKPAEPNGPQEYEGKYFEPQGEAAPEESLPWLPDVDGSQNRLDSEIKSFAAYMRPSDDEQNARIKIIDELSGLLAKDTRWRPRDQRATLQAFGSQVSGLALANSDIDLNYWAPWTIRIQNPYVRAFIVKKPLRSFLEKRLAPHPDWILASYRELKFPIITMQHRLSGIDVQIVGSPGTAQAQKSVAHYLEKFPTMRDVFAVVRQMLGVRGFLDVYHGGIGSYAIFNMLVASYLHNPSEEKEGARLLGFLEFWARHDLYRSCVSIDPPLIFPKSVGKKNSKQARKLTIVSDEATQRERELAMIKLMKAATPRPYLLVLQDPADPLNNLGKKTGSIKHIQTTIMVLEKQLRARLAQEESPSLLAPLVGRSFDQIGERRKKAKEYLNSLGADETLSNLAQLLRSQKITVDESGEKKHRRLEVQHRR